MDNPVVGMIEYGGDTMYARLHQDGSVSRRITWGDQSGPTQWAKPSGEWRIVGAVRLNNFGHEVEHFTLADILAGKIAESDWKHKNRKQRIHVLDFDHGTRRMWGCPTHSLTIGGTIF